MQKLRYFPPEKQARSTPPQELKHIWVPGKRKPLIKQVLAPIPPRIDNRVWLSVQQVIAALAKGTLHKSFANRALAEARAYEQHFRRKVSHVPFDPSKPDAAQDWGFSVCDPLNGTMSEGFSRRASKPKPDLAARAIYLRAKLKRR
jgi:hypothetical protein